jgi:SIR2-like domain
MDTQIRNLAAQVASGQLIPYLGPDILHLGATPPPVPTGARELAQLLSSKVAVPGRLRNNLWHSAQYIESHRHRMTLDRLMADTFRPVPEPGPIHRWLAGLPNVKLIVDTWYDGTMAAALGGRGDWGLIQGASKARRVDVAPWFRAYDSAGGETPVEAAEAWGTVLYKPHGAAQPAGDVLVSDSDYVEVLSEIDIQSPIPEAIRQRRTGRGFLFLGCRFYDQILRNFARAILKRSGCQAYAVVPPEGLTPNEIRFFATERITPLPLKLAEAAALLAT